MPGNVCKHCGCDEIDEDAARGDKVCTNCGSILEEQLIVSDLQFTESGGGVQITGQFVSDDGNISSSLGGQFRGLGKASEQITMNKAREKIQEVAGHLSINQRCQSTAEGFFKMALHRRLTRGRKTTHVVASCLYLAGRLSKLPHMLLDYSDILRVNVYELGKTYLCLTKELSLEGAIPVIDPTIYIERFSHKLQFGDKRMEVANTASRLVQRMVKDFIQIGRRPSGLCGAALLVAARIHDFNRTVKEIIKVVKVCESTIRKRLYEFEDTPSSKLSIEEFHNIDLEEEQDPPCFTEGKRRTKMQQAEEEESRLSSHLEELKSLQKEIEKSLIQKPRGMWAAFAKIAEECSGASPNETAAISDFIEKETMKEVMTPAEKESLALSAVELTEPSAEETAEAEKSQQEQEPMRQELPASSLAPTTTSPGIKEIVEDCIKDTEESEAEETGGELDLDGIDEEELDRLLLSESEVKIKTEIWMKENEDYLIAQKEKEEKRLKEEQEQGQKPPKKKRKYKKREKMGRGEAATTKEAVDKMLQEKKWSRKINYDVLKDLCSKDKQMKPLDAGSTYAALPGSSGSILKGEPSLKRRKLPSLLSDDSQDGGPLPKKKSVQIQEPFPWRAERAVEEEVSTGPQEVVVESGPLPCMDPDIGTDEDDDEDGQGLYGREVSMEDEDHYYDYD